MSIRPGNDQTLSAFVRKGNTKELNDEESWFESKQGADDRSNYQIYKKGNTQETIHSK
jgi:hypothetical protein